MPAEVEWFDFKRSHLAPEKLGAYLSTLANEAALRREALGYLVFGVDDETHEVVGTSFDPYTAKAKGNQALMPWLTAGLRPNPGVEPHVVEHPDGRVVVLAVGPAREQPVTFQGTAWARTGNSLVELNKQPEKARALWTRGSD